MSAGDIHEASEFDVRWTAFVLTYTGSDEATRADLVQQVLHHGLERALATGAVAWDPYD